MLKSTDNLASAQPPAEGLRPFFMKLIKTHNVPMVTSYTAEELQESQDPALRAQADNIALLQFYVATGNNQGYADALSKMEGALKEAGFSTRTGKGMVYLTRNEGKRVNIEVAVQVKGAALTWYFWAPGAADQYPQEFRDKIYDQAAICHRGVKNGCDLYYRGSNSVHVKMMHHEEAEAGHNHNHYRLRDGQHYTPEDFRQHMEGFHQNKNIEEDFFEPGEIDEICKQFAIFHADWNRRPESDRLDVVLPTKSEQYFSQDSQRLSQGDVIEIYLFGQMQEPCRLDVTELKVDYDRAREAIDGLIAREQFNESPESQAKIAQLEKDKALIEGQYHALLNFRVRGGSRGLNAAEASARQIDGSVNPVVRQRQNRDDSIGMELPDIPEWAVRLKHAAKSGHQALLSAAEQFTQSKPVAEDDVVRDWISTSSQSVQQAVEERYGDKLCSPPAVSTLIQDQVALSPTSLFHGEMEEQEYLVSAKSSGPLEMQKPDSHDNYAHTKYVRSLISSLNSSAQNRRSPIIKRYEKPGKN